MSKKWLLVPVIGLLLLLIFPFSQKHEPSKYEQEYVGKQTHLALDVDSTRNMQARHYTNLLHKTMKQLSRHEVIDESEIRQTLQQLQSAHPEWKELILHREGYKQIHLSLDSPSKPSHEQLQWLKQALSEAPDNQPFYSPFIRDGSGTWQVVGWRDEQGNGLAALVLHHTADELETREYKLLRLDEYPEDAGKNGMDTIDSRSMEPVRVRNPEQNEGTSHIYEHEVVVKFTTKPNEQTLAQIHSDIDGIRDKQLDHTYIFASSTWSTDQLIRYFKQRSDVSFAEPHYMYYPNGTMDDVSWQPNDELFDPYQWNLPHITTLEGWGLERGSDNIHVAVLDTGVDLSHVDLQNKIAMSANMIAEDQEVSDPLGHGTHVAGIISANVNNEEGIAGISWYNRIMPVKVLDDDGTGSAYAVAKGVIWAADQGATVINMSLGNYADAEFLHDAIRYAYERDVLIIAATGNDNTEQPGYPAAYPEVLAVGANDANGRRAPFSNYGDYIDVTAPGVQIPSTYPGNQYAAMSGTSMASPHAAALAAMIRSARPDLNNEQVMDLIRTTANDLGPAGWDRYTGYGEIDVKRALEYAIDPTAGAGSFSAEDAADSARGWWVQKWEQLRRLFP